MAKGKKKRSGGGAKKCPGRNCKVKLTGLNTFLCKKCNRGFCNEHQYPCDHDCQSPKACVKVPKMTLKKSNGMSLSLESTNGKSQSAVSPTDSLVSKLENLKLEGGVEGLNEKDELLLLDGLSSESKSALEASSGALGALLMGDAGETSTLVLRWLNYLTTVDGKGGSDLKAKAMEADGGRAVAYGLAQAVNQQIGVGLQMLETFGAGSDGVIATLKRFAGKKGKCQASSLYGLGAIADVVGRPAVPLLLAKPSVISIALRAARSGGSVAKDAAYELADKLCMALGPYGLTLVMPAVFDMIKETAHWKTKAFGLTFLSKLASRERLQQEADYKAKGNTAGSKSDGFRFCAYLPRIMPYLMAAIMDTKTDVADAATAALPAIAATVQNAETLQLVPSLTEAMLNPATTEACLDELMDLTFVNAVDGSALSLILPVVIRGLRMPSGTIKMKACTCAGNIVSLVANPLDILHFSDTLLEELNKCCEHSRPEVRKNAERAKGFLERDVKKAGESEQSDLGDVKSQFLGTASECLTQSLSSKKGSIEAPSQFVFDYIAGALAHTVQYVCENSLGVVTGKQLAFDAVGPLLTESLSTEEVKKMCKECMDEIAASKKRGDSFYHSAGEGNGLPSEDILVDLKDIILAFTSKVLLQRTRFYLKKHRRYCLVGQNGVGKTTLLDRVATKDIQGFPQDVSCYYIQHEVLDEDKLKTVTEYMHSELPAGKDKDMVNKALYEVGFTDEMMDSPMSTLSGGWRMKLAIARSMLHNADLLLLDEPTNHLDVATVEWLANYLCNLKDTTIALVSHDYDFCSLVATDIVHMENKALHYYPMNFRAFQKLKPEICAALPQPGSEFDLTSAIGRITAEGGGDAGNIGILPIRFPNPGKLDGIKSKGQAIATLKNVSFRYPETDRWILKRVSTRLTLGSRTALLGANGAGKTTLLKLLVGELEFPVDMVKEYAEEMGTKVEEEEEGEKKPQGRVAASKRSLVRAGDGIWNHHNLRTAYIGQHSMHHLGENLEQTPLSYISARFERGMDKELSKRVTIALTAEEKEESMKEGAVCECVSRSKKGKHLVYEFERIGRHAAPVHKTLDQVKRSMPPYVMKLVKNFDEKMKAYQAGSDIRPLTQREMIKHLADFGVPEELAHRKIRWMSGGQKCRLVLAAAMWTMPHLIALDEPTNYLDNDTLAALTSALSKFRGAVVTISHNEGFVAALCKEHWEIKDGCVSTVKVGSKATLEAAVEESVKPPAAPELTEQELEARVLYREPEKKKKVKKKKEKKVKVKGANRGKEARAINALLGLDSKGKKKKKGGKKKK